MTRVLEAEVAFPAQCAASIVTGLPPPARNIAAFATYCSASIVWPCLPISRPRSSPVHVHEHARPRPRATSTRASRPIAPTTRSTSARMCVSSSRLVVARRAARRSGSASVEATTRAGV